MASIQVQLNVPSPDVISTLILDAIARKLKDAIRKSLGAIKQRTGDASARLIQESPEYTSLLSGKLRGELGVVNAAPILQAIINNIRDGIRVTDLGVRRVGQSIEGGLRIEILKGDYSEVLGVSGASFTSENGYEIDWLRWLTLEGDRILVSDHYFFGGFREFSRTGAGIMHKGHSWRVPPEFSGTESDNWLMRALSKLGPDLEKILQEELQRNI